MVLGLFLYLSSRQPWLYCTDIPVHPKLVVGVHIVLFLGSNTVYTRGVVVQYRWGILVQVCVDEHIPICVYEPVLEHSVCPLWPHFYCPHSGFHTLDKWWVQRCEEQREMVWLSNVGEGCCFVGSSQVGVNMVQSSVLSGVTGDMLVNLGKTVFKLEWLKSPATIKAASRSLVWCLLHKVFS